MSEPIFPGLSSVVIVAADSGPLLRAAIDSALASSAPVEVILVDNASQDGEVERALSEHSGDARLRLVRNASNLGFGPACNRGAAVAHGDVFVFLNPDCELQPDTLEGLRGALDEGGRIGLLGVVVYDAAGLPGRGNRRRDPTLRRALMSVSGLARFEARWPALAGIEMPAPSVASGIEYVDAVSGACMTVRRRAFEEIGGFDEAYFLHAEDLDLCRRLRAAGWRVALTHDLCVRHLQGSSSRRRPLFVARHKHRGMWRYFRTFDPAARNPLLRAAVWSGIWAHFLVIALRYKLRGPG
ncbi:glycosyltransferase family 2 protein [Dokdonella sp.]|uniref:glycosyltransferase family 2 protein n=1 Tax=Dokdonella sp. TaxID=2291710 RepID=UPI001B0B07C5|nr:glycosyltransferase family 2 protein [Dokdonella sp.]MBO9665099.1 glycosyltransferase family 2 protein [Dokdonella sp.]